MNIYAKKEEKINPENNRTTGRVRNEINKYQAKVTPRQIHTTMIPQKKPPPMNEEFREIGRELKYLPGKSFKTIAYTKQLRVNGTRKQREVLEEKDFVVFIDEYTKLSFSPRNPAQVRYKEFLLRILNKAGIFTVKDLLKNVIHLHEITATKHLCLSEKEIDVATLPNTAEGRKCQSRRTGIFYVPSGHGNGFKMATYEK